MRNSKKTLAILAMIGMLLMMMPVQVFGADATLAVSRLAGTSRADTAIQIANNGWSKGTASVVVVPSNDQNLVDALAVSTLAKQMNAPVLITGSVSLDPKVAGEIAALKATNVLAVGALSNAVVASLKVISGVTVQTVKGADRFATAAQLAAMVKNPAGSIVVGYNGLPDALSAASYAAANGYVILIADENGKVPASEAAYLGSKVIILGGPSLVADVPGATRVYGADRYATNDKFIVQYAPSFKFDTVYVASGDSLVDALPGAVLAAQTNSPIVLGNTQGAAAAADVAKNLTSGSKVIAFGGAGVVPDSVVTSVQTGKASPSPAPAPSGPVAVQSVKASAANQFQVTFTAAPADTSKVTFAVSLAGTAVTATPTWSSDKTVATLTGAANYAPGTYTVAVKNDTADLGSNTATITQQTITKIDITSKEFAVTTLIGGITNTTIHNSDGVADGSGFITYTVEDQYGNDITNSALANGITWTPGISQNYVAKNGVICVAPPSGMSFNQYTSMSITGYDSTSGISASATLPISNTGTLSGITLNKLTSPNDDDLNAGNTTGQWYIDYTALDASGNSTSDFKMVNEGILNNTNINGGGFLTVKVVPDPSDSTKAAISVTVNPNNNVATDMQIPITVVTTNGQSSTLNVTLKKAADKVDSIVLSAPAAMVASGDTVMIPFTATDPTGKVMTNYTDICPNDASNVTLTASNGLIAWTRNADGTAAIQWTAPPVAPNAASPTTVYISATVTTTGKFSQLTVSVQKPAVPDSVQVDNTKVLQYMQTGAKQFLDFGNLVSGLTINDQYGRPINMTNEDVISGQYTDINGQAWYYYIDPIVTTSSAVSASGYAYGGDQITLTANSAGTATVNYEVYQASVGSTPNPSSSTNKDTGIGKSVSYTVVKDTDIAGYTLDAVAKPLRMLTNAQIQAAETGLIFTNGAVYANRGGSPRSAFEEYAATSSVWGKTSGGAKVVLNPAKISAVSIDSSDFALFDSRNATGVYSAPDAVTILNPGMNNFAIWAHDITENTPTTNTSSSTNLTVTVLDSSGNFVNVTQKISSITDSPVASAVTTNAGTFNATTDANTGKKGLSVVGNDVKVNLTEAKATFDSINGKSLMKYDSTPGEAKGARGAVIFKVGDQFSKGGGVISYVQVTGSKFASGNVSATVNNDANGTPILQLTRTAASSSYAAGSLIKSADSDFISQNGIVQSGDYIIVSAVTPNGKMGTVKIVFTW